MSEIDAPLNELRRYTASNVVAIYSSLAVVFTGFGATKHKIADCRLNLFTLMYADMSVNKFSLQSAILCLVAPSPVKTTARLLYIATTLDAGIVNRLCFLLDCRHQSPSYEQNRGGICLCTLTEDGQCRDQNT